jgi:L-rhamnose mutarotase
MVMERVSFVMRVKEGMQDEYIRRHRKVWPEVLAEMRRAGVTKMGIFLRGAELFVYMEAQDYQRSVRLLNDSPEIARWERFMAPIMEDVAGKVFNPENAYPESLPEVFFWEPMDDRQPLRPRHPEVDGSPLPGAPHFAPSNQKTART